MPLSGDSALSQLDQRAWAIEQSVKIMENADDVLPERITTVADMLLAYIQAPAREVSEKLLQAARDWDGRQDAGALIGLLADELERMR